MSAKGAAGLCFFFAMFGGFVRAWAAMAPLQVPESILLKDPAVIDLLSAYAERDYYTSESHAVVVCRLRLSEKESGSNSRLVALAENGRELASKKELQPETDLLIPLKRITEGRVTLNVELRDRKGNRLAAQAVELVKRPPKPGDEVKIDRRKRVALVNGQPFFPFGFWYMGGNLDGLRELGAAGFNTVCRGAPAESMTHFLDEAQRHNIRVIPRLERFGVDHESGQASQICHVKCQMIYSAQRGDSTYAERSRTFQETFERELPSILAGVEAFTGHPALLSWYTFDEPANKNVFALYRQGRELTRRVHEIDGYHPIYMMGMQGVKIGDEDTDWCDIMGHDPYWVPARVGRSTISYAATLTRQVRAVADVERKPVWMIPVAERIAATYKRYLNAREQRCQTYLALISGARGLIYYHWPIRFQNNWEMFCDLAREVQTLSPALLGPGVVQKVSYSVGEKRYRMGDVLTALFRNPDGLPAPDRTGGQAGGAILLSANYRNYPVEVTIRLAGLDPKATVKGLFNDESYNVSGGAFVDRFDPFATRAYAIHGDLPTPAEIAVEMKPYPELAKDESPALPYASGRPGRKNLLPNPSFEDATNPGWPDYYDPPWFSRSAEDRIGLPGCPYFLDTENPWHGRQSFRIEVRKSNALTFWLRCAKPVVLSAWMRASRDGVKARVVCGKPPRVTWGPLTTQWRRYSVVLPEGTGGVVRITPAPGSTVWIDGVQVEAGAELTDFEP